MKTVKFLGAFILCIGFASCNNEQSLQEYYVENQQNSNFVALDVPSSIFSQSTALQPEQREVLETIKKINLLAIPQKSENAAVIEKEKVQIGNILQDDSYQLLMRYGGGDTRVEIYFTGDEEAVDEIIVYGFDKERGLGIARVLGDDMNPSDIINLAKSMESGDIDIDGITGITKMFIDKTE